MIRQLRLLSAECLLKNRTLPTREGALGTSKPPVSIAAARARGGLIHPHAGFAWSYYGRPEDMLASAENTPGGMVAEPSTDLVSHIVRPLNAPLLLIPWPLASNEPPDAFRY